MKYNGGTKNVEVAVPLKYLVIFGELFNVFNQCWN